MQPQISDSDANNKLILKFVALGVCTLISCGLSVLCLTVMTMAGDGGAYNKLQGNTIANIVGSSVSLVICIGFPLVSLFSTIFLIIKKKSSNKLYWLLTLLPLLVLCTFIALGLIYMSMAGIVL